MSGQAIQEHRQTAAPEHAWRKSSHDSGLLLIGLFKLTKSIFFFLLGIGAFHLLHKDLGDEVMKLAMLLRRDPEGHLVSLVMEKVDLIDTRHMREIGFATFAYSGLALIEGIGLTLEKVWAEYLTLSLTVLFLPWECFELFREATIFRVALLLINLAVLAYLLWLLDRKKKAATTRQPA